MLNVKKARTRALIIMLISISIGGLVMNCTHENEVLVTKGFTPNRGTARYAYDPANPAVFKFDKTHCNVNWETPYQGVLGMLTGRFDTFGITKFVFVENNKDSIAFEFWVWINSVNTSEPGRDHGCLAGNGSTSTFGVTQAMTTETENQAIIKSKSVEYSTSDNGYIVTCDLTFHGFTHEVTAKLTYDGVNVTPPVPPATITKEAIGFSLDFSFLSKTDYGIVSSSIADKVDINCNVVFRRQY